MSLPQIRTADSLFPAPAPGNIADRNPPSFQWVPTALKEPFQFYIRKESGETIVQADVDGCTFRLRQTLSPGRYFWNVAQAGESRGEWEFTLPPEAPVFLPPEAAQLLRALPAGRPRHIYFPDDLPQLAKKYAPQLDKLARTAAAAQTAPLMPYPDIYRGAAGKYDIRSAIDAVRCFLDRDTAACALLWLFRKDAAAGERARQALLHVCEWNPAGPASVDHTWGDEVGLSIVRVLPAVFDWIYPLLSPDERRWAAQTLRRHAQQIYEQLLRCDYCRHPGESHAGRLPAYLGEMALVLHGEIPESECCQWLEFSLDIFSTFFPHYGSSDGGWAEGAFYGSSYSKWYLPFFFAVERLSGFSFLERPFYQHAAEYFTHFAAPGMEAHPFGDGHWPTAEEWPGFQAQNPFSVYADRYGSPLAREFSRRCDEAAENYQLHLLDIILPAPQKTPAPSALIGKANSYAAPATGAAALHTDAAHPEKDIAVFARASRYGTPSHQHADQGDFAILAGGQALVMPSGTFGYQFGDPHHRLWTQQTAAANCVMIDGQGQKKDSADACGAITACVLEENGVSRLCLDLQAAYPQLTAYTRCLEFDHASGRLRLTDTLSAGRPFTLDFRLHSSAAPERTILDGREAWRLTRERGQTVFTIDGGAAGNGEYSLGDVYAYPNGAEETAPNSRQRSWKQYHLNWQFRNAAHYVISATFITALTPRRNP